MQRISLLVLGAMLMMVSAGPIFAEDVSKEQIKGLDEQIQDIKGDVIGIAAELNQLEEKLLYPSNTQVSLFVSVAPGDKFRLDAIEIQLDGKDVAKHLYSAKELDALRQGGVQRIYTGNIRTGEHDLQVKLLGKSGSSEYRKAASWKITKEVGPKLVQITLAGPNSGEGIAFKDW